MIKNIGTGFLLALQFFSVIPVRKQLEMESKHVTSMYVMLPIIGGLSGGSIAAIVFLMRDYSGFSSLLMGFIVVLAGILMTGGLHMDGVADAGDAYFSYQEREKRLEIMEDPRIGAFGAMALLFLVLGKIIIVAEVIAAVPFLFIMAIPILSRTGLLLMFSLTKSAKSSGLAAFFQQKAGLQVIMAAASVYLIATIGIVIFLTAWWQALLLAVSLLLVVFVYRKWCLRNFGGMTGDLLGAFVEGAELILWTTLLFFI